MPTVPAWLLPALLAVALAAAWLFWRRREQAARKELLARLDRAIRLLASQLGRDSELLDVRGGALVVRIGEKTVHIDALLAIERLEDCPAGELGDRVRWLVNHAELTARRGDRPAD